MKTKKITEKSIRKFEIHLFENEKSPATIQKYVSEVRCLEKALNGEEITKESLISYRDMLKNLYQARTVNGKLSAINAYLAFLGLERYTVRLLKIQRQTFIDDERELTERDYRRLLDAARRRKNPRLYYLLQTMGSTGVRVSELKFITVESLRTGRVQIQMKGKNRTVILPRDLILKLKQYVRHAGITGGSIFCTRNGKEMDRSNICHEMKALCEEARVERGKVFPHNLRHLFARCFYAVEKNLALLADILGHSSIETTRIYVAVGAKSHERIMKKMQLVI